MGYRDEITALKHERGVLLGEVEPLRGRLAQLEQEQSALKQQLRKRRVRVAVRRGLRWAGGHPKICTVLAIFLALSGWAFVERLAELREQEARRRAVLGSAECGTALVVAPSRRARVRVNQVSLGWTPISESICPGQYVVRVASKYTLPWQRRITVRGERRLALAPALIPWQRLTEPGGGLVVLSDPPDAVVFVNGREVGLAPVYVPEKKLGRAQLRLGLWAKGYRPTTLAPKRRGVIWAQLAAAGEAP